MTDISAIQKFLLCPTPDAWLQNALAQQDLLLIDHANCEKKAAGTAMNLLYRYVDKPDLLYRMSRLAREELRHFEQVLSIMAARGIEYVQTAPARYAGTLHKHVRTFEPAKLIDTLIIGAFIEARSCERFARLAPLLDDELSRFYTGLLSSESRHFQHYLQLAQRYADKPIAERVAFFAERERELIEAEDVEFRFHSGPVAAVVDAL
ncbi:MAG: tRNA-(ms[2]io[6]A)-hydroxylase [Verrucomicrobiaceae bacterium]|nr:tRNA-(ms[2]io[6]A)-hydroxylase [Verrucomicrobiaceae bacterium]